MIHWRRSFRRYILWLHIFKTLPMWASKRSVSHNVIPSSLDIVQSDNIWTDERDNGTAYKTFTDTVRWRKHKNSKKTLKQPSKFIASYSGGIYRRIDCDIDYNRCWLEETSLLGHAGLQELVRWSAQPYENRSAIFKDIN